MKKHLSAFLIVSFLCSVLGANDFPNNSFEYDFQPVWNRMPDEDVMRSSAAQKFLYSSDRTAGKRSLHLKGRKVSFSYESNIRFRKDSGIFALWMKSPSQAKVKVQCVFYLDTNRTAVVEKIFNVNSKWNKYEVRTGYHFSKFRRSGITVGPVRVIIDPGKDEVLIDECVLAAARKMPKKVLPGPVGGVPEKTMSLPVYIPLPSAGEFAKGKCAPGSWEFRLFPGKGGAEKGVPVSGVMLFPQSKVFFNSGTFSLYDGQKKLSARYYPIAAWPKDRSLAALKVDFTADTASKVKTLKLRFTPGALSVPRSPVLGKGIFNLAKDISVDLAKSNLWDKNGTLGPAVLMGTDYTGKKYTFKAVSSHFENGTLLRRGKMVSADGLSLGAVQVRLTPRSPRQGLLLDAALSNNSSKFIPIRELYWQCRAPGKESLKRTIWGDHKKQKFTELSIKSGKKSLKVYSGKPETLPSFTLKNAQGISLHVFNGAQTFPNEIEFAPGIVRGALWPSSAKVLSLAPGLTLRKKFLVSPAPLEKTPDHPALVMPSAKAFAGSGVLIPMCASDPQKLPFFESRIKQGLGRMSPRELAKYFCYGQFNYGDHPGDGGWGNLESFEDYVLFHRAMREEDPQLFRLAQTASAHYADIDTDSRSALPYVHSANHIIGGTGFGHAWIPGVMSAWLLSGDPAIYQTARRMLASCIKLPLNSGEIQYGRNFGFYLLTLAEGYAIFNDPAAAERYMAQLKYQVNRFADGKTTPDEERLQRTSIPRQNSLFYVNASGLVPFHCWYGLTAFLKMYDLKPDPFILKVLKKEFANIMDLEMTYRPQIETHWPGLPAEKLLPTIATDYLFGRGAFFYPVLAMYARLTGERKYLDLAVDTAYCGLLASRTSGNIQDVFMAAPLADLPKDFSEARQIAKICELLWKGAAPELLNGDFSQSLLYSDLVIPKKGIGSPRYPKWALKKPYPRFWHLVEGKQIISSMFMTFRGSYYTLDHQEFGRSAPSLRLDMSARRYFNSGDLTSAKFRMEPGEWEFSVAVRNSPKTTITQLGLRIMGFGNYVARVWVHIAPDNKKLINKSDHRFKLYNVSYRETGKPGWKKLTYRFRLKEKALGTFHMRYQMNAKAQKASIHIDDVSVKRIGN